MRDYQQNSNITLRDMVDEDILNVTHIAHQDGKYDAWSQRVFVDCLSVNYPCVVALVDEIVAGFCIISMDLISAHILNIGVEKTKRGIGIGSLLMKKAVLIAEQNNLELMRLEVSVDNIIAQSLYKKFGFRELSLKKDYYTIEPGLKGDAYLYEMLLKQDS